MGNKIDKILERLEGGSSTTASGRATQRDDKHDVGKE